MESIAFSLINSLLLAQAEQAAALPAQPPFGEVFAKMMPMFVVVFFVFYLLVLKPQQVKLRKQEELSKSLKKGDEVVTTSGLIGRVFLIETDIVVLDVGSDVKLKFEKEFILKKVTEKAK